jgi:hypothetical protein
VGKTGLGWAKKRKIVRKARIYVMFDTKVMGTKEKNGWIKPLRKDGAWPISGSYSDKITSAPVFHGQSFKW